MNKRLIFFEVVVSGNPTQSTANCIRHDYQRDSDMNIIWYTDSKKKAEESLVPSSKNILDTLGIDGESMPCSRDYGIAEKAFILSAFRGDNEIFNRPQREELADLELDDELCEPPKLRILPATAVTNCGISSKLCYPPYRVGPPANRAQNLPPG